MTKNNIILLDNVLFKRKIKDKYINRFSFISDFVDNDTKIKARVLKCQHIIEELPCFFYDKPYCTICRNEVLSRRRKRIEKNKGLF